MTKLKIGLYCYLTADILTGDLHKFSLCSPLPNVLILSQPLNLIGCHGNRVAKFPQKNIQKSSPQKPQGEELETLQKCLLGLFQKCSYPPWDGSIFFFFIVMGGPIL